jgi:hypothetical protein
VRDGVADESRAVAGDGAAQPWALAASPAAFLLRSVDGHLEQAEQQAVGLEAIVVELD